MNNGIRSLAATRRETVNNAYLGGDASTASLILRIFSALFISFSNILIVSLHYMPYLQIYEI